MRHPIPLLLALALTACDLAPDSLGEFEVEAEVPLIVRLPPEGLPPAPDGLEQTVRVTLPVDFVQTLREQGRGAEADTLAGEKNRVEAVELVSVRYEVPAPNGFPGDIEPIALALAPEGDDRGAGARPLGRTLAVPGGRAMAERELTYAPDALDHATPMVERMRFVLVADARVRVPPDMAVEPSGFGLRLRMRVRITASLF